MKLDKALLVCVGFLACAMFVWERGQAAPPNAVAGFMRAKLPYAESILGGIAIEDFELIEKNANNLGLISREANWMTFETPEYVAYSAEFRRSLDSLSRAAKEKDVDGATLAYMDMTLKCVSCHKHVRDTNK